MYQKLLFCVYMTAFSSTTTIFKARKLSLKDSLSGQCCATSLCSCSSSSSLPSSSSSLVLLLESLSSFSVIAYSSVYMKQYKLSLTSGLRFVIILLLQELCNVCRISIKKQFGNFLKVGNNCSFRNEWTGPPIGRCSKPFPNHSSLPEYHYLPYNETPREGRHPDNCIGSPEFS